MRIIEPRSWRPQPWRNGAGVTHELVRWPDTDDYAVRISVADVIAPAPFSAFAGLDRWLYLLGGGPVTLALDAGEVVLAAPGDGLRFAGEARVAATAVAAASRDLNFMVRRDRIAHVEIVRDSGRRTIAGQAIAVFAIAGAIAVDGTTLPAHACAWMTESASCEVAIGDAGIAALLRIEP